MQKKSGLKYILSQAVAFILLILSKTISRQENQHIWLIACGGERWGDNADAFWRYMSLEHPEINTIAVVKNKHLVKTDNKNWIKRNSLSSYLLILRAEVIATTHTLSDLGPTEIISFSRAKKVWLQHGVIAIGKITAGQAKSDQYDLICASSKREKEIMMSELGIKAELIALTGLARHDVLKERIEQQLSREGLLFIPTSRRWLDRSQKEKYEDLLFSWINYLMEKDLKIKIKLWLHPGWYKSGLGDLGLDYGIFEYYDLKQDPQKLICASKLLVTDYSSVFFDAALSGIPTIFYQPDRSIYIEQKGILKEFLNQNSLMVVEDKHELLLQIDKIVNNSNYYSERLKQDQKWAYKYVETFDGNSCRRIYEQIMQLFKSETAHDNF